MQTGKDVIPVAAGLTGVIEKMRKSVMVLLAVVLLAAGSPRGFIPVGLNEIYEDELSGNPEPESEPELESESGQEEDSSQVMPESEQSDQMSEENSSQLPNEEGEPEEEAADSESNEREESEVGAEETSNTENYGVQPLEPLAAEFTVLSSHEAVVKTYGQLKSALADDNGITTIYFGDNITMQDGIKINPKKADILIVGLNPQEPDNIQPYTLTDMNSVTFTDTVYVNQAGTRTIHIRDLTMIGKNYYGPFSIADIIGLQGLVITYERVSYDGPQLCHHRRGTARFVNVTANIHGGNSILSYAQEFSEAKHVIFEGANTIDNASSTNTIFWHPLGGSFVVADDASLVVTSPNTSTAYGAFFTGAPANKLDITVGRSSVLDMTISGIVAPEVYITISSFTVQEGGAFYLKTTKAASATVLRIGGDLIVDRDAEFIIHGIGGASFHVLRQHGGDIIVKKDAVFRIIAQNPYAALLNLSGRGFICDDPKSVLLYNMGRNIVASTSAGSVHINAQQVNYWIVVVPDGFAFPPLYGWRKADNSNFMIDGTLPIGSSANFSQVSSNYTEGDPPGLAPSVTTFSAVSMQVLAFGRLELVGAKPSASSGSVEGVTEAGASVRVSFTQNGTSYTSPDFTADSNGEFHIPVGVALESGTIITIESSWQYLTARAEVTVEENGSLELFAPHVLEFYTMPLSPFQAVVKRLNPDWRIVVTDARETKSQWSVYAKLDRQMIPESADLPALEGALVFVDNSGNTSVLNTDSDTLILEHTHSADESLLPIMWDDHKGILLTIQPGTAFVDALYTAVIRWTIVDGV